MKYFYIVICQTISMILTDTFVDDYKYPLGKEHNLGKNQ